MLKALALAVLLCAPTAHCQKALPPIPDSIPSALVYVKVVKVANLRCLSNGVPVEAYGCFSPSQRAIAIRDSMSPILSWVSLEHERVHLQLFEGGFRFADREQEDLLCRILSAARVQEMLARL